MPDLKKWTSVSQSTCYKYLTMFKLVFSWLAQILFNTKNVKKSRTSLNIVYKTKRFLVVKSFFLIEAIVKKPDLTRFNDMLIIIQ